MTEVKTVIRIKDFNDYLYEHKELQEYADDIVLYENPKKGIIILPSLFYHRYPSPLLKQIIPTHIPRTIDIEFTGTLRDEQKEIVNKVISMDNPRGIIHAKPGIGKTVIAIYLACHFKFASIFMIDNSKLLEQWKNEILKFTTCTEDDIGILSAYNKLPENKKLYIGMVQTFLSRIRKDISTFYQEIKKLGIGLVVYDECHKTTAGVRYSKSSIVFDTDLILGLSATPYTKGVRKILLENSIGKVIVGNTNYDLVPEINFIHYKSDISDQIVRKITSSTDMNRAKSVYNSEIHNSRRYLNLILKLVKQIISDPDRRLIVICWTIQQVETIYRILEANGIPAKMFYSKKNKIDKTTDKILIATYQYASHGFDYKELTDIILASPFTGKTSMVQCIGRILRSMEGKSQPRVYDIIDYKAKFIFNPEIKKSILKSEFKCSFRNLYFDDEKEEILDVNQASS